MKRQGFAVPCARGPLAPARRSVAMDAACIIGGGMVFAAAMYGLMWGVLILEAAAS